VEAQVGSDHFWFGNSLISLITNGFTMFSTYVTLTGVSVVQPRSLVAVL
jgi:hypothetical protein